MIICLAGMHRSGTSLMSSYLEQCGVRIGERLVAGREGNELGHFEDRDFLEFHRKIMKVTKGGRGDIVQKASIHISEEDKKIAAAMIEKRRHIGGDWGWKEPRTTLFLNFWHNLVPDAHFLFLYRDPYMVVDSIYRRMQRRYYFVPWLPFEAWILYNEKVIEFVKQHPECSTLVNISGFNSNWEAVVKVLSSRIGVVLDKRYDSVYKPQLMNSPKAGRKRSAATMIYLPVLRIFYSARIEKIFRELEELAFVPTSGNVNSEKLLT